MSTNFGERPLRAARVNRVFFGTDEKRIRTKNTVTDKSRNGLSLSLCGIAVAVQIVIDRS